MVYLSKEGNVFQRDEKGELIPIEVELKGFGYDGQKVRIKPCTIGSWDSYKSNTDESGNVSAEVDCGFIALHLVQPVFTSEELKFAKPALIKVLVMAILRTTGWLPPEEAREKKL